jgi:DNA-directed RNA polymerase subunit RPC12/RpoP
MKKKMVEYVCSFCKAELLEETDYWFCPDCGARFVEEARLIVWTPPKTKKVNGR